MKYVYIIITALWSFTLFSQEIISESKTVFLSKKDIKKNMELEKFFKVFTIQNSDNQPFVAMSVAMDNSKNVNLQIRYKLDEWSVWENLTDDIHQERENYVSKNLFYIPQYVTKIEIQTYEINELKNLKFNFFYPGFTVNVKNNKVETTLNKMLPVSCNCPIPANELRLDWCPSGNCPAQTSPTFTTVTHLIVHHSAGNNTSSDWAATVRSIWNYHVNGNNWSDIGYNYLIDPNGVIYEGRGDNILGAHFSGMNSATMGVCLLGNFDPATGNGTPTAAMISSLEELLSWKECNISKDPLLDSYHTGSLQTLMNISGHRDAGTGTVCPGDNVYDILPNIRTDCSSYMQNCSFITNADLVVSSLSTNPTEVVEDADIDLVFAVGNGGSEDVIEAITIDLKIDGSLIQTFTMDSIHSGEVINFTYPNYIFSNLGNYNLCLYISTATNETNTANNSYCKNVEVANQNSDLIVKSISQNITVPEINEDVTYLFKIENIGVAASSNIVLGKIIIDGDTKKTFNILPLNENEIVERSFTLKYTSPGNKEVCLELESPSNEIEISNNTNCKTTIVLDDASAIKNIDVESFSVYPNPTNKYLNIELELKKHKNIEISIYNSLGKKILSSNESNLLSYNNKIDISSFSKGIYIIDINIEGNSLKKKIILN